MDYIAIAPECLRIFWDVVNWGYTTSSSRKSAGEKKNHVQNASLLQAHRVVVGVEATWGKRI